MNQTIIFLEFYNKLVYTSGINRPSYLYGGGGGHLFDNYTSDELTLSHDLVNNKVPSLRDFSKT